MARKKVVNVYVVDHVAFVPHPIHRGLWMRTDTSVIKTACPSDYGCGALINEPCRSMFGGDINEPVRYTSSTHYARRRAARKVHLEHEGDEVRLTIRR